jgi:folate-binding protein YgfZ
MASEEDKTGAPTSPQYGLLQFRGADAQKFLQGQLSNDVNALGANELLLAGVHNPQGRVLALLRLAAPATDHIIALLPAELAETISAGLRRYVLRAKVAISAEVGDAALAEAAAQVPAIAPLLDGQARARAIAAGIPQVYRATSGEFVAQMLNLDCIGAISFNKGCYTGQEIIARSHYRGRTKRRLQRFASVGALALEVGESVRLGDGRSARIVDAVALADGRSEFLAVAPLDVPVEREPADNQSGVLARQIMVTPLTLPYPLPD